MEYQSILNEIFIHRQQKNPAYSIRAFARDLNISASMTSSILNGKKKLSLKSADQIAKALNFTAKKAEVFKRLVKIDHVKSPAERDQLYQETKAIQDLKDLDANKLDTVFQWQGLTALELTQLADFNSSPEWIAKRLKTSPTTAKKIIENLLELGLLKIGAKGELTLSGSHIANQSRKSSSIVRKYHESILRKAVDALHNEPVENRYFGQFMIATDETGLEKIRLEYEIFRNKVRQVLSEPTKKDRVINLSIQAFRLDHDKE